MKLKTYLKNTAGKFFADKNGNFTIFTALAAVPLILISGVAIDLLTADTMRQRLQASVDAAALSLASDTVNLDSLNQQQILDRVNAVLEANLGETVFNQVDPVTVNISNENNLETIDVSASITQPTTFLQIVGSDSVQITESSQVQIAATEVEIVLVLDVTGSMNQGGRLNALRDAANNFINIVVANAVDPNSVRVGIVPFSNYVNVGTQNGQQPWIVPIGFDRDGDNILLTDTDPPTAGFPPDVTLEPGGTFSGAARQLQVVGSTGAAREGGGSGAINQLVGVDDEDWEGCVTSRAVGMRGVDADFETFDPDPLLNDLGGRVPAPIAINCADSPIVPLTNSANILQDAINDLNASGQTYMPLGIEWGRYVLSPQEPFTGGTSFADAADDNIRKIMIIMTDGGNENFYNTNPNLLARDGYSRHSPISSGNLNRQNLSVTNIPANIGTAPDIDTIEQCNLAKGLNTPGDDTDDIEVFTIAFNINQVQFPTAQGLLENCATNPANFFQPQNAGELNSTFETIAATLSQPLVTQ